MRMITRKLMPVALQNQQTWGQMVSQQALAGQASIMSGHEKMVQMHIEMKTFAVAVWLTSWCCHPVRSSWRSIACYGHLVFLTSFLVNALCALSRIMLATSAMAIQNCTSGLLLAVA